jgi:hypothetical protein
MNNSKDELNLELVLDTAMLKNVQRLSPHLTALDLNQPRRISRNLKIPNPVLSTIGNYLKHARAA